MHQEEKTSTKDDISLTYLCITWDHCFSCNACCCMQWSNNSFDWRGVWLERIESPLATLPDRVTQPMFYSRGPTLAAAFAIVQNIVFHKGIFSSGFVWWTFTTLAAAVCLFCETVPLPLVKTLVGRSIGKKVLRRCIFEMQLQKVSNTNRQCCTPLGTGGL